MKWHAGPVLLLLVLYWFPDEHASLANRGFPVFLLWAGVQGVAIVLAGALAGCGFHLRGDVTYPFATLFINSPANVPFTVELKRALAGSGTQLVDSAAAAQVIFDVSNVTDDKQVLSLSGGGRAREYLLTKRVTSVFS